MDYQVQEKEEKERKKGIGFCTLLKDLAPSAATSMTDPPLVLDDLDGELRSAVELEGLFARLLFDLVAAEPAFFFHLEDFRRISNRRCSMSGST